MSRALAIELFHTNKLTSSNDMDLREWCIFQNHTGIVPCLQVGCFLLINGGGRLAEMRTNRYLCMFVENL